MIHTAQHALDKKNFFPLDLAYDAEKQELTVTLDTKKSAPWKRLVENIQRKLLITSVDGQHIAPSHRNGALVFSHVPPDFSLYLNEEHLGTYHNGDNGLRIDEESYRYLTEMEMRRIGTFYNADPYPQQHPLVKGPQNDALLARAKKAVFTDFHSHSSSHISAEGMIQVAIDHGEYYPIELLGLADIETHYQRFPKEMRKQIKRVEFPPLEVPGMPDEVPAVPLSALRPDERHKLALKMAVAPDRTQTFTDLEYDVNRFRYPLSKHPKLAKDIWKQTARELLSQGIRYAEISTVGIQKPALFRGLFDALKEIEQDPELKDITFRCQVGIPRNWPTEKIEEILEKTKILADSSYITGLNIIGNEDTKTSTFWHQLDQFCDWANEHKPGFTIAVHAGENNKNLGNVREVLELAKRHPNLHFRIGHGVYGLDAETLALAKELCSDPENPRVTIESNPDSVIGLDHIDDVQEIPYDQMVKNRIPLVAGSDAAGAYNTDAEQLGCSLRYAGMDEEGFDWLEQSQTRLMNQQLNYIHHIEEEAKEKFGGHDSEALVESICSRLAAIPEVSGAAKPVSNEVIDARLARDEVMRVKNVYDTPEFRHRLPITTVGAEGDRWPQIKPSDRREIAIAMDMLFHLADPAKVFSLQGRTKLNGFNWATNQAIKSANEELAAQGKDQFLSLCVQAAPSFLETESYKDRTHMVVASDSKLVIAREVVKHTFGDNDNPRDGIMIGAGGAATTRNIIHEADMLDLFDEKPGLNRGMFLFDVTGASGEKAKVLNPRYRVADAKDMVLKICQAHPEIVREGLNPQKNLQTLYQASSNRIDARGYDAPINPADQIVIDGHPVNEERKKGV